MKNNLEHKNYKDIKFYKAIEQYKLGCINKNNHEHLVEALRTFIECAIRNNAYAIYFVKHIYNKLKDLKLSEKHRIIIEKNKSIINNIIKNISNIPQDYKPDSWLNAINLEIKYINSNNNKQSIINQMEVIAPYCSYAYKFLFDLNKKLQAPKQQGNKNNTQKKSNKKSQSTIKVQIPQAIYVRDFYFIFNISNKTTEYEQTVFMKHFELAKQGKLEEYFTNTFKKAYMERKQKEYGVLANQWLVNGALMGDPNLQYNMTINTNISNDNKVTWLKLAAKNDLKLAALFLGELYLCGTNGLQHKLCENQISNQDIQNKGIEILLEILPKFNNNDYEEIYNNKQIDIKNIISYLWCYLGGIFERINSSKGFEYYLNSAELGDASGMFNVGSCYINGIGTTKDIETGLKYLEKIPSNHEYYNNALKIMLECKVKKDLEPETNKYQQLYKDANNEEEQNESLKQLCEIGFAKKYNFAISVMYNQLFKDRPELFFENIKKFVIQSDIINTFKENLNNNLTGYYDILAKYYLYHHTNAPLIEETMQFLEKGAENSCITCLITLGNYYKDGFDRLKISAAPDKALSYMLKAETIDNSNYNLLNSLGCVYKDSKKQPTKAIVYFEKALKQATNDIEKSNVYYNLSEACYDKNEHENAFKYINLAKQFAPKDADVHYKLYQYYNKGIGVEIDTELAEEYLISAASLNVDGSKAWLPQSIILLKYLYSKCFFGGLKELDYEFKKIIEDLTKKFTEIDHSCHYFTMLLINSLFLLMLDHKNNANKIKESLKKVIELPTTVKFLKTKCKFILELLEEGSKYLEDFKTIIALTSEEVLDKKSLDNALFAITKIQEFYEEQYCKNRKPDSNEEIKNNNQDDVNEDSKDNEQKLLTHFDNNNINENSSKILEQNQTKNLEIEPKTVNNRESENKIQSNNKQQIKEENLTLKQNNNNILENEQEINISKKQERVLNSLDKIIESNPKKLKLDEFNTTMEQLNKLFPGIKSYIRRNNGSKVQYYFEKDNKRITTSIHKVHGTKGWEDPNRGKTLIKYSEQVKEQINKKRNDLKRSKSKNCNVSKIKVKEKNNKI